MKAWFRILAGAAALAATSAALAQAYPSKPIRFVVGFPAGSSIDVTSRILLDDVRARTGATIVIDNKPGALGAIGVEQVERAPADGYTLMPSSSATHSSGPHLGKALQKLDPVKGLTHVARVSRFDIAVVTSKAGPYKSAKALIDAGQAKPDALTYGYGSGTGQVGSAAFSHAAGIQVRPIPYKGQPAAVTDLLGGRVDFVASDLGAILPFLKEGSLSGIAVLAERRSPLLPDVPTAREVGLTPVLLGGWVGFDGPAKLPPEVVTWWTEQLAQSLAVPAVQDKLRTIGMEGALLTGDAFAKFVDSEQERWGAHVRQAGIQAE
ncbi:tripartite tricarboxylate transporter substrate binding protein [Ramlibacter sp. G-1-2-2]|uniref:Tripartite tricarboxylate transporter substrate binding protein n=1 Tax=Ramlibacter agri TaxID=2728837 RepID=A0A848HJ63_9BURK|nr:tripartite tricarboxylate transporter substrate binding protein [Ramlibacter agri]NML48553.1 tripartite tricarboxylate transporter substrate binding protein [Ramlibacter agri]